MTYYTEYQCCHSSCVSASFRGGPWWSSSDVPLDWQSRLDWSAKTCCHCNLHLRRTHSLHHTSKPSRLHLSCFSRRSAHYCCIWLDSTPSSDNDSKPFPIILFQSRPICETVLCGRHLVQCAYRRCTFLNSLSYAKLCSVLFKVMLSPFFFPVTSDTFNFVRTKYSRAIFSSHTCHLGLRYIWQCYCFRSYVVVLHTGRKMAPSWTHHWGHARCWWLGTIGICYEKERWFPFKKHFIYLPVEALFFCAYAHFLFKKLFLCWHHHTLSQSLRIVGALASCWEAIHKKPQTSTQGEKRTSTCIDALRCLHHWQCFLSLV